MRKIFIIFSILSLFLLSSTWALATSPNYNQAVKLGEKVVTEADIMLDNTTLSEDRIIVLTNAGYAEPGGYSSRGCLDGITSLTTASPGSSTLICLQSRLDKPLWFSFYNPESGQCAYLQLENGEAVSALKEGKSPYFELQQTAIIRAEDVFANPDDFVSRAKNGLFGENLFRVVTVSNAAAKNFPDYVLKTFVVHDHYCPGVTSGALLVKYIQKEILSPDQDIFILSLEPWCKEDALTTLLNATPGKRSYGVWYPENKENWSEPLNNTDTVIFTKTGDSNWTGHLLSFEFPEEMNPPESFGHFALDKLYMDLWFYDKLDEPERFIQDFGKVELPEGMSPKVFLNPWMIY